MGVLLHPAQAEAIVSALDKVPATVPADDLRVAEQQLVELGRTHGPLDLRKAGRLVRDRLDTDGPEPAEQKAYDRESLTLKNAANGVAFTGYLANDNAELFRTLIHTHAKPHKTIDGAPDPRPRTKRQADALTTLLTTTNPTAATTTGATAPADTATAASSTGASVPTDTAATTDSAPAATTTTDSAGSAGSAGNRQGPGFTPGHGPKPHITVTIDYNDLKAATADKLGHLIYGDALSAATIRRLACDAHILPIVLGSDSQPLDVGTTVRLATGPIRKALITRDKGCVCCGAPPIYCDAHHVKSWIDGGATKITNLVLLCKRCHRDLHAGHWTIHITNGIVEVARPAWATPNPVPRDRYRPPTTTPHPPPATPTTSTTTGHPPTTNPPTAAPQPTQLPVAHPRPTQLPVAHPRPAQPRAAQSPAPGHATPTHPGSPPRTPHASTPGATPPTNDPPARRNPHPAVTSPPGETPPPSDRPIPTPESSRTIRSRHRRRPGRLDRPRHPSRRSHPPVGSTPGAKDRTAGIAAYPSKPARPAQAGTGLDIWGDTADPNPAVDRRSQLGTEVVLPLDQRRTNATRTFDPWHDLAPESADEHNPADDDPKPSPHSADPLADTTNPHKASTTAA